MRPLSPLPLLLPLLAGLSGCAAFIPSFDRAFELDLLSPAEGEHIVGSRVTFEAEVLHSPFDAEVWISTDDGELAVFRVPEVASLTMDTFLPPGTWTLQVAAEELGRNHERFQLERTITIEEEE